MCLTISKELLNRGYLVEFVVMRQDGSFLNDVPAKARVVNLNTRRLVRVPTAFAKYLKAAEPHAVLTNMWPLTSMCVLGNHIVGRRRRVVVCDHCTLSNEYKGRGLIHRATMRLSLAATYRAASARVCVSGGVADDISRLGWLARSSMSVIHNPIAVPPSTQHERQMAEQSWAGFSGKRILTVGSFKPQKNHMLLIRSFASIANLLDVRLMLLGDGVMRKDYLQLAHQLGVADKIIMPGFAKNPFPYYETADLFVLSSDYEGFGNVIVEALACGIPVVSTDCPSGPAEILSDDLFGLLAPVGDADALAVSMQASLKRKWNKAILQERAKSFSPARIVNQYITELGI